MTTPEALAALAVILAACLIASVWVNVAYSQQVSDLVSDRDKLSDDWWRAVCDAAQARWDETEAHLATQDALTDAEKVREKLAHVRSQRQALCHAWSDALHEQNRLAEEVQRLQLERSNVTVLRHYAPKSDVRLLPLNGGVS